MRRFDANKAARAANLAQQQGCNTQLIDKMLKAGVFRRPWRETPVRVPKRQRGNAELSTVCGLLLCILLVQGAIWGHIAPIQHNIEEIRYVQCLSHAALTGGTAPYTATNGDRVRQAVQACNDLRPKRPAD